LDTEKPCGNSLLQQRISPRITTKFSLRDFSMNHNPVSQIYRDKGHEPLTFGFDIGMASVGWAVLNETRIVALGVRAFDKAETAKEGESLNLARRSARLMRRRLRRRAWRLTKLARMFKRVGLIEDATYFQKQPNHTDSAWVLRLEALDRKLKPLEWARVIFHLCKHRGFYWTSRAEEKKAEGDAAGESGKVKKGLADTKRLFELKNYRTAAEMVLAEFPDAQRNKHGEYSKALSRTLLADEVKRLFEEQRRLGNEHAADELQLLILGTGDRKTGLFWAQKPALAGKDLLKMLGHCTFEKGEYRAPKASFTAERHVWLTRLNNVRITVDGKSRPLNEAERNLCLLLPYEAGEKFTYKNLRAALVKAGLTDTFRFTGFSYPSIKQVDEKKAKNPEEQTMVKLAALHDLRLTLKKAGLESEWQQMSVRALDGDPALLDAIAWVLSVYKEDEEVEVELRKLQLPGGEKTVDALLDIRFDKFHALSLKALRGIVPHMHGGMRYDEACIAAGYHHSQLHVAGKGTSKKLPPLYTDRDKSGRMIFNEDLDVPRNPVVLRAINQARKVLNALVKTYGSPARVHIELARDLSRPFDERRDIKKEQDEFRDRNEKDKAEFASHPQFSRYFGINGKPRGSDFEKWRLYREQNCKCAYSLEPIELERLLEPGYLEIDHALPYSRSFDDSKNNKVLVFTKENREKGNRTPFEYLDGANDSEAWRKFVAFVGDTVAWRQAKRSRLLRKDFSQEEASGFRDRNLNDTRYIAKFFKNYVEKYLQLADGSDSQRCVVLSGQLTAFLRMRWGLLKVRDESDRHHALDAVVIAACSHGMVKRLSDYSRRKELEQVREGFVDLETGEIVNPAAFAKLEAHFPAPWNHFRDELQARLKIDDPVILRAEMERLGSYPEEALQTLKPLFVSRAPQRRNSGAVHKETIYAQPERLKAQGGVTQKINVANLTLKDMDKLVEPHRNEKLYATIRKWVENRDANEKRAKEIEQSAGRGKDKRALTTAEKIEIEGLRELPRKPTNDGMPGPIVRSVTMDIDKLSGISIRGGIAKNDTMLRVDIFTKSGKFHVIPVYVHHKVSGLPDRAVIAFKEEHEWTIVDDSFTFCFSLHPNDLVQISQKNKLPITGYYSSCHRGTGNLNLWAHDRNILIGKNGLIEGLGVKTALSILKFDVDVIGRVFPAKPEIRHGLA
jgi:CRISPR-associated endonuclease Csn1